MLKELNEAWANIPMGQLSGSAPTNQGGPFDNCIVNGSWSPEHQAAHGGPIPMPAGAPSSNGIVKTWPYNNTNWTHVGHSNCTKVGAGKENFKLITAGQEQLKTGYNWANMAWQQGGKPNNGSVPAVAPIEAYGGYSKGAYFQNVP